MGLLQLPEGRKRSQPPETPSYRVAMLVYTHEGAAVHFEWAGGSGCAPASAASPRTQDVLVRCIATGTLRCMRRNKQKHWLPPKKTKHCYISSDFLCDK